jgi:hypothetical protein
MQRARVRSRAFLREAKRFKATCFNEERHVLSGSHVALAARAECVMLDKRPFIHDGIAALETLLERMADHQHEKTPELRLLWSWPAP